MSQKQGPSQMKNNPVLLQNEEKEDIDELLKDVELHRPGNRYTYFVRKEFENFRKQGKKVLLGDIVKSLGERWKKLPENEKKKNDELVEEDRRKFKRDCEIVKNYLLNYNKENSSPFRIFLDTKLKEAFEEDKDPIEARKEAREQWENMSDDEKEQWKKLKIKNDKWWKEIKHFKTINAYALFVKDKIIESNKTITLNEVAEKWKKITPEELKEYRDKANQIAETRKKMRDIYEISHGIRPAKPIGAYSLFIKDAAREGKFKGKNPFKESKALWEKLSEKEKDEYLKKYKRLRICYLYKLLIYKKKISKGRRYRTPFQFFLKSLKGKLSLIDNQSIFKYGREQWTKLSPEIKKQFELMSAKDKALIEEMKKKEKIVAREPKKVAGCFSFFLKERFPVIRSENPGKSNVDLVKILGNEWNSMSDKQKKRYIYLANEDNKRYVKEKKEFKAYIESKNGSNFNRKEEKNSSTSIIKQKEKSQERPKGKSQDRDNSKKKYPKARGSQREHRESSKRKY